MLTKKMKIILISIGGALIVGGGLGLGLGLGLRSGDKEEEKPAPIIPDNDPCPEGECIDEDGDGFCDNCGYPVDIQHGVKVTGEPSAPFYLKVGDVKNIRAKLDPSPDRKEEKTFTWTKSNSNGNITPDSSNTANATVEGVKEGSVVFTATNDYNQTLIRRFNANVINYDDDNMYLWEFQKEDRAKFGYVNEEGKKAGVKDGTATLGDINWTFHRSDTFSLQSQKGGIGFGKGGKPETLIQLSSHNERQIKKIVIETASANALSNITVKVGDNIVINEKTPSYSDEFIGSVSYRDNNDTPQKLTGDISIQFDTPNYDESRADDRDYKGPGAVYLKSILIEYYEYELDWKTNVNYDFEAKFLEKSYPFESITGTAKPVDFVDEENGIQIKFEAVTTNSKLTGQAATNKSIEVISTKPDEVIKKVSFIYQNGSTAPAYEEHSSVFGGDPYLTVVDNKKGQSNSTTSVGKFIMSNDVSSVKFYNNLGKGTQNYVGIKSIQVKTVAGNQLKINKLEFAPDAAPNKTSYFVGETFDPDGLGPINVSFTDETVPAIQVPSNEVTYYDENTHEVTLSEGTTAVVGSIQGVEIKVEGLSVTVDTSTKIYNRVKSNDELVDGDYLFVIPSTKQYWDGTKDAGLQSLGEVEIGDSMELLSSLQKSMLSITCKDGLVTIKNKANAKIGMTEKGGFSVSSSPKYSNWSFEVNDGFVNFAINGGEYSKYLVFSTKIELGTTPTSNIALYKVSE